MSTELPQQIKNINNEVKYKYGDFYAEQVNEVINDVYHNLNIKTTIGLVDFIEYVINDDHKQSQINALKKDVKTLQEENKVLKEENKTLKINYESNIDEINKTYEEKIKELNDEIDYLKLTPAKRKKIDKMISSESEDFNVSNNIEDGGQF